MVAGAPSPELDAGGSELQCLQHILEPKRPKGKGAVGTVHAQVYLWIFLFPGSPGRYLEPQAPSCLELTFLGLDTRDQGWLCLALPTLILSLWHLACVFLSVLPECPGRSLFQFFKPETPQSSATLVYSSS